MRLTLLAALSALCLNAQSFDPKMPPAVPAAAGSVVETAPLRYIEIKEGAGAPAKPAVEYDPWRWQ